MGAHFWGLLVVLLVFPLVHAYVYTGSPSSSFTVCGVSFSSPFWYVEAPDGNVLILVDHNGNVLINSDSLSQSAPPSSLTDAFILDYNNSYVLAVTPSTAYVPGGVTPEWSPTNLQDSLLIEYSSSVITAFSYQGGIFATGNIVYQGGQAACSSGDICVNSSCVGKYVYVNKMSSCAANPTINNATSCSGPTTDGSRGTSAGCKYTDSSGNVKYASSGTSYYAVGGSDCPDGYIEYQAYVCKSTSTAEGVEYSWVYNNTYQCKSI